MITNQFLYESYEQLYSQLSGVDENRSCLIQIFTNELMPSDALSLAQKIHEICPEAHIIGTSVSGVIYRGEQYDNHTLVVVEQYDAVRISSQLISIERKTCEDISREIQTFVGESKPVLMRLFVGGYYDYAHQLIEQTSALCNGIKIVGGMAGQLHLNPQEIPFIFDAHQVLEQGLVFCTLQSSQLMVYGRINTAHETIGEPYTITESRDKAIISIEGVPAKEWLQHNFGVLSTKEYKTWEEIAQNDPLVRLQLALEDHKRSIRFIHYDEMNDGITQYFSRLPAGTQFRISYTSPSKCAEESLDACREVATTPIEHLFCYSCLFRKLYLKNCAKWELSPYYKNPVNGVFLLGEFGYSEDDGNALLNGSCVLSGVAEKENYLAVDMSRLDALEDIRDEDEKLMEFIVRKQREQSSDAQQKILEEMIAHESSHITNPYQRINLGVSVGDLSKYEQDKEHLRFNKLCMVRAENADVIVGQRGQIGYFAQMKHILEQLMHSRKEGVSIANLHFYCVKSDTFLIASNQSVDRYTFSKYIHNLQKRCDIIQKEQDGMPFLIRFVMVRNHQFILERAYAIMENCRNSQAHVIEDEHFGDGELTVIDEGVADELACIRLIRYALDHDKVVPYYQGLHNNKTGKIDRYESLMRLMDADGNVYAPNHFMEVAKKYRLYLALNLKMFLAVLRDFSQLDRGVGINLSVHDILSSHFGEEMRQALRSFPKPSNLTFEILEDECIANIEGVQLFIKEVRSYGVKIAVDDFGSGYSNLLEIAKIRPDKIKIDGQIIKYVERNKENQSILEAISLLGERLSIELVAEFVETEKIQAEVLKRHILYSQGYYFSLPKPFEAVLEDVKGDGGLRTETKANHQPVEQTECNDGDTGTEEERDFFRAIQALASDLLFRLDLSTGQMRHFGTAQIEMGVPDVIDNFPQSALDAGMVAKEDAEAVLDAIHCMRQGIEKPGYFRIFNHEHIAHWYRMDYKLVFDQRNVPIEVVGKLTDIQQQKDMEARINIDTMTGCLRKDAFETLTSDYMMKSPDGKGVLIIVDLDNFKSVNDNLGHQFGDRVLQGVGNKLRALFRGDDYVGRIGGDEFMVMMIGTDSVEIAKKKADEILNALNATYSGSVHSYHVSASIGIATYPSHGDTFQTLYDHADMALFDAKNHGKNGYVVYHNTLSKGTMENTLPYEVAVRTLAQHYDHRVVEEAFNLLFETKEFDISIQTVLELVGKRFGVSRCYVIEKHPTMINTYQNSYEWCKEGVTSEKWRLEELPVNVIQELVDQANDDGILYCNDLSMLQKAEVRDIMEVQGIKSFLHTYIMSDETVSYTIGVDECECSRVWTPIEVSTILQTGKIIAQFLSYKNAIQDLETVSNDRLSILDSLNYSTYIVDCKTFELTYFNDYVKNAVPDIELGKTCYEAIRKKDVPCDDCPLRVMEQQGVTNLRSVLYDTVLGRDIMTMSTMQPRFAGRECACVTAIGLDNIDGIQVKR